MTRTLAAVLFAFLLGIIVGLLAPRSAASSTLAPPPATSFLGRSEGFSALDAGSQTWDALRTPRPSRGATCDR